MSVIRFIAPPLPHYIASGFGLFRPGQKHLNRKAFGVFDLLVVQSGCLYIGEEDRHYEAQAGHAVLLRPDLHHYPTQGCETDTWVFWLHFDTGGEWSGEKEDAPAAYGDGVFDALHVQPFAMLLPQFVRLLQPGAMYEKLRQLNELERHAHNDWARWRCQLLFAQVLELLNASLDLDPVLPGANIADRAASYLRQHYQEDITAEVLGDALNFHPVYIARCMQKEFGCSPFDYLLRYRLAQAKRLLQQTDLPVARIAEETGFRQPSYFSSIFAKHEGLSPRAYRRRFSGQ
ncbi:helix-turn-helix transcriptional regulator [Paenibacillus chartarius]|uniref:Helix-turn-helix transcriptional regulator n=1 Tax=Paenibacillus chartarius TaxID=747481 RepID=A0ABV6DHN0_9BACL